MIVFAPFLAKSIAACRPIPEDAPVINTTFPLNLFLLPLLFFIFKREQPVYRKNDNPSAYIFVFKILTPIIITHNAKMPHTLIIEVAAQLI